MFRRSVTALVSLTVALPLLVPGAVLATDPVDGQVVTADGRVLPPLPAELDRPTIHAEMLGAEGAGTFAFEPGATPTGPRAPRTFSPVNGSGSTSAGTGGTSGYSTFGLPNGLRSEVLGFLPYWMLNADALSHMNYQLVSTIAYFSVGATRDGYLAKGTAASPSTGWAGWTSSHMTNVIDRAHANGGRVVLTVTMMAWNASTEADMAAFLNSSSAQARLVGEIVDAVRLRNADGVNLDFEPVPSSLRSQFTAFVRRVKQGLVDGGVGAYLTVCVTGGSATWATGYDIAALGAPGAADHIFVMGYDYHWSGSSRAGGVAPMSSPYTIDIEGTMADFLEETSPSKLIWGVPYYGRWWRTSSDQLNATTLSCPSGEPSCARTGSYMYTGHRNQANQYGRLWDSVGKVPWYRYWNSSYGTWVQAYYDDAQSLSAKYELINARGLAGTGMWTLLMDQGRSELWQLLADTFAPPFDDIGSSPFRSDINWLAASGITSGCTATSFCPKKTVTREQMASFLARALKLPAATRDYFADDAGSTHEADINRIAAAGITGGCGPGRFCPGAAVTRAQMASFLVRARNLTAGAGLNLFDDDNGSPHEADIDRLAHAGITGGCATRRYCPASLVTREQMAAFLRRAFG